MQIFLSSLLILTHFLCLSLPSAGATLDYGSTEVGNYVVVEHSNGMVPTLLPNAIFLLPAFGPSDTIKRNSRARECQAIQIEKRAYAHRSVPGLVLHYREYKK